MIPIFQVAVSLVGLVWSVRTVQKISAQEIPGRPGLAQTAPVVVFNLGITVVMIWLLVG